MNILVIRANDRPDGISTQMADTFLEELQQQSNVNVTVYDTFAENLPYFGQSVFSIYEKSMAGTALSEEDKHIIAVQKKIAELTSAADVLVFAFPLWNLTVPVPMHSFIDFFIQPGVTFKHDDDGTKVLLFKEKKAILLNARGGFFSNPAMAHKEMAIRFIEENLVEYAGVQIVEKVIIEGHKELPEQAETIVREGMERVRKVAQTVSTL